jgi:phosphate butyryltransferase
MFHSFDELLDAARARGPVSIAVAGAHDPDVIEALKRARELHLAGGILVGKGTELGLGVPRHAESDVAS